jgi:hypothetical protein
MSFKHTCVFTLLAVAFVCLVIATTSGPSAAQTPNSLPPPPSADQDTSQLASGPPPAGGFIQLRVQLPETWASANTSWQDLWTVVQWQDEKGTWRDIEGWQGMPDGIEEPVLAGKKKWWVMEADLGKGPFRWVVYQSQGGQMLATSAPFDLPESKGETVRVEASLKP